MIEKIKKQLGEYFANSKKDFWIGLQNFQGIREFTKIPLAPITLLYGQNSAGKSSIHDAQQFIYGYFSGSWDRLTVSEHLERWANYDRLSKPLNKNFLGYPEDVVISVCSVIDRHDFFDWKSRVNQDRTNITGLPELIFNVDDHVTIPFRFDLHFSQDYFRWKEKRIVIYLGDDVLAEFLFDYAELWSDDILKINKNHLAYTLANLHLDGGIHKIPRQNYPEGEHGENWFLFCDMEKQTYLESRHVFAWCEEYLGDPIPSNEILDFRAFILSLIQIPANAIEKNFQFTSVPPLRPIPSKQNTVFRFTRNSFINKNCWEAIAEELSNEDFDAGIEHGDYSLFGINEYLANDYFLNTGYKITGDCRVSVPSNLLTQIYDDKDQLLDKLRNREVSVHLKLKNTSNGHIIEIEDVGVGISQIIPVLSAILIPSVTRSKSYKAFIQQPELHLHPKLQAQLGDVFISVLNKHLESNVTPTFIIESHSEHLLLRLLRRIRESHRANIQSKQRSLSASNVSVLYVDKLANGDSKIFPLRISPEGDFIDRWPHGFFTERDGDLFDE